MSTSESALASKTIMITRPREQAQGMLALLQSYKAQAWLFPTIEIKPLSDYSHVDQALKKIASYDWLLLTSINGVKMLKQRWKILELPHDALQKIATAVIGKKTYTEAQKIGLNIQLVPPEYVAESLAELFLQKELKGKKILSLRAQIARQDIIQTLSSAGALVTDLPIYSTCLPQNIELPETLNALKAGKINYITFTSASTVSHFAQFLANQPLEDLLAQSYIASIGPITSNKALEVLGRVDIEAQEYTLEGLIQALEIHAQRVLK